MFTSPAKDEQSAIKENLKAWQDIMIQILRCYRPEIFYVMVLTTNIAQAIELGFTNGTQA